MICHMNWRIGACLMAAAATLGAQPDNRSRFEVASVKPSVAGARTRWNFPPGEVQLTHSRLQDVVPLAYGLQPFQVSGGPGWFATEFYDVVGKLAFREGAAPPRQEALDALQVLLEDRFKLHVRRESKVMSLYRLTVGPEGSKLRDGAELPDDTPLGFEGRTRSRIVRKKMPLSSLVTALAAYLGSPVEDQTGLPGAYSFVLEWQHDDPSESDPAMIAALRAQLGLNLQSGKGPVGVLVIESAERPAAN